MPTPTDVRPRTSGAFLWASDGDPDRHASLRLEVTECPRCWLPVITDRVDLHLVWHEIQDHQMATLARATGISLP